jgi:hypothetical protein
VAALYHGTRASLVESIRKEGLRPDAHGVAFAAESRAYAQTYADNLDYPKPNPEAVVLLLQVPNTSIIWEKPMVGPKDRPGNRIARIPGGVRPEWVVEVLR